jgi:hypothetical protein
VPEVTGYFHDVAAAAELFTNAVAEVKCKDAAAKGVGLTWDECCRAFGCEYLELKQLHSELCHQAAMRYSVDVRHMATPC